jgi:hypothetical protein
MLALMNASLVYFVTMHIAFHDEPIHSFFSDSLMGVDSLMTLSSSSIFFFKAVISL